MTEEVTLDLLKLVRRKDLLLGIRPSHHSEVKRIRVHHAPSGTRVSGLIDAVKPLLCPLYVVLKRLSIDRETLTLRLAHGPNRHCSMVARRALTLRAPLHGVRFQKRQ